MKKYSEVRDRGLVGIQGAMHVSLHEVSKGRAENSILMGDTRMEVDHASSQDHSPQAPPSRFGA